MATLNDFIAPLQAAGFNVIETSVSTQLRVASPQFEQVKLGDVTRALNGAGLQKQYTARAYSPDVVITIIPKAGYAPQPREYSQSEINQIDRQRRESAKADRGLDDLYARAAELLAKHGYDVDPYGAYFGVNGWHDNQKVPVSKIRALVSRIGNATVTQSEFKPYEIRVQFTSEDKAAKAAPDPALEQKFRKLVEQFLRSDDVAELDFTVPRGTDQADVRRMLEGILFSKVSRSEADYELGIDTSGSSNPPEGYVGILWKTPRSRVTKAATTLRQKQDEIISVFEQAGFHPIRKGNNAVVVESANNNGEFYTPLMVEQHFSEYNVTAQMERLPDGWMGIRITIPSVKRGKRTAEDDSMKAAKFNVQQLAPLTHNTSIHLIRALDKIKPLSDLGDKLDNERWELISAMADAQEANDQQAQNALRQAMNKNEQLMKEAYKRRRSVEMLEIAGRVGDRLGEAARGGRKGTSPKVIENRLVLPRAEVLQILAAGGLKPIRLTISHDGYMEARFPKSWLQSYDVEMRHADPRIRTISQHQEIGSHAPHSIVPFYFLAPAAQKAATSREVADALNDGGLYFERKVTKSATLFQVDTTDKAAVLAALPLVSNVTIKRVGDAMLVRVADAKKKVTVDPELVYKVTGLLRAAGFSPSWAISENTVHVYPKFRDLDATVSREAVVQALRPLGNVVSVGQERRLPYTNESMVQVTFNEHARKADAPRDETLLHGRTAEQFNHETLFRTVIGALQGSGYPVTGTPSSPKLVVEAQYPVNIERRLGRIVSRQVILTPKKDGDRYLIEITPSGRF